MKYARHLWKFCCMLGGSGFLVIAMVAFFMSTVECFLALGGASFFCWPMMAAAWVLSHIGVDSSSSQAVLVWLILGAVFNMLLILTPLFLLATLCRTKSVSRRETRGADTSSTTAPTQQ